MMKNPILHQTTNRSHHSQEGDQISDLLWRSNIQDYNLFYILKLIWKRWHQKSSG